MLNSLDMEASVKALQLAPAVKRKRAGSQALTPPLTVDDPEGACLLSRAVHVLSTAATALSHVTILYQSDPVAREGLVQAVEVIKGVHDAGGKLLVCGVGKSGLVGKKTVASMKSLGIGCSFLHPAEALHGDLGDVRPVCTSPPSAPHPLTKPRMTPSSSSPTPERRPSCSPSSTMFPSPSPSWPSQPIPSAPTAYCSATDLTEYSCPPLYTS